MPLIGVVYDPVDSTLLHAIKGQGAYRDQAPITRAASVSSSLMAFAATACIVGEAGGWASDIHGQPLELNRQDSTFMNHQGVVYASNERIARYLTQ